MNFSPPIKLLIQPNPPATVPKPQLTLGGEAHVRDSLNRYVAGGYLLTIGEKEEFFQELFRYQCFENIYKNEYMLQICAFLPHNMYDLLDYRSKYLQGTMSQQTSGSTVHRQVNPQKNQQVFQGVMSMSQQPSISTKNQQSPGNTAPHSALYKPAPESVITTKPLPPLPGLTNPGKFPNDRRCPVGQVALRNYPHNPGEIKCFNIIGKTR